MATAADSVTLYSPGRYPQLGELSTYLTEQFTQISQALHSVQESLASLPADTSSLLLKSANLSDVANAATALSNLGGQTHSAKLDTLAAFGTWKALYTDSSQNPIALALGAADTVYASNGAAAAPTFKTVATLLGFTPVTNARTITAAGLVTGGGDLTANRTVTVTAAIQSDQETGSSNAVAVTPGVQQFHKSAAKAWVVFDGSAGTPSVIDGYNVASITDNGSGDWTVNFTTSFSSANYAAAGSASATTGGTTLGLYFDRNAGGGTRVARTVSAIRVNAYSLAGAATDSPLVSVVCYGDQ